MALYAALLSARPSLARLAGVISLSGYLPADEGTVAPAALLNWLESPPEPAREREVGEAAPRRKPLPVLLCHGDKDPTVRYAMGLASRDGVAEMMEWGWRTRERWSGGASWRPSSLSDCRDAERLVPAQAYGVDHVSFTPFAGTHEIVGSLLSERGPTLRFYEKRSKGVRFFSEDAFA